MKSSQLMLLAVLGVGVYLVMKSQHAGNPGSPTANPSGGAQVGAPTDIFSQLLGLANNVLGAVKGKASTVPATT